MDSVKSVLFLGIGGVSMHQLAIAYRELGYKVYGYDSHVSEYTEQCKKHGIKIIHKFDRLYTDVDMCIKTAAVKENDRFVRALRKKEVKILDRAEALAEISTHFKCVIAVAGTHGKSTTSALIYEILRTSGKQVSCHIGADVFSPRFNLGDDYLVVEACEYNKSFLSLVPTISVITNVEAEHMDSYGSIFNLRSAFTRFLKKGVERFVYLDETTRFLNRVKNIHFVKPATLNIKPKIHGKYNMKNISLAIAVAKYIGIGENNIISAINGFMGLPRRYELIGQIDKSRIYIDYAHHPTEIESFVTTFNDDNEDNLIIFQPHTYSRTKNFLKDFVRVFSNVQHLCIYKEYPARENRFQGMTAYELYREIKKQNPNVKYSASYKSISKIVANYSAIAFVGAGDINEVAKRIVKSSN